MTQLPGPARRLAVAAGVVAVLAGAACGDDEVDLPTPVSPRDLPAGSTPEPTLNAEDAEAWTEIQTRFDTFMETWIRWAAEGIPGGVVDPASVELAEHASDSFYDGVWAELVEQAGEGQVRSGRPEWRDARPVRFDWERTVQDRVIPEAVFEVCVDDTEWVVVNGEGGEPVDADPGGPHLWTVTAWWAEEREFGPDGWALATRDVDRSESC